MIVFTVLCESDKNHQILEEMCTVTRHGISVFAGPLSSVSLVQIVMFLSLSQSTVKILIFVKLHWSKSISILIFLRNINCSSKKGHRKPGFDDILRKTQGTDDGQNHRSENVINEGIWTPNGPLFGGFWTPFPE